ncbi:MAG: hypothetical protein WCK73_02340 [Deltaproteobacteria bacterium]
MRIRPSRPKGRQEVFLRMWTQTRFYKCRDCGWRDRRPRTTRDGEKDQPDLRFWAVAIVVALGFIYLLLRDG